MKRILLALLLSLYPIQAMAAPGCESTTVFLCHGNSTTNASTSFTDQNCSGTGAKTITANGNVQIDTTVPVPGITISSIKCDGTGDYISMADSNDWNMGVGAFSMEGRFRFSSTTGNQRIMGQTQDGSNSIELAKFADDNTLKFIVTTGGSQIINFSGTFTPSTNTWYHLAVYRGWGGNVNGWAITVDGVPIFTTTDVTSMPDLAGSFYVGSTNNGVAELNGFFAEVMIMKGDAKEKAQFTPRTSAYCQACEMTGDL